MIEVTGWALWYSDGTVVRSSWATAPSQDVQALVLYHPNDYRTIIMGEDEYRLEGEADVKYGAWMDEQAYNALIERALEE